MRRTTKINGVKPKTKYTKEQWDEYKANNPFKGVTGYVPKEFDDFLKTKSAELKLPINRLVAIALDNEMISDSPFEYSTAMPEAHFVESAYTMEAGKILTFVQKYKNGVALQMLMLARRQIGVPDKELFMLGYREILASGLVTAQAAPFIDGHQFGPDYYIVKAKQTNDPTALKDKEIRELEARLAALRDK